MSILAVFVHEWEWKAFHMSIHCMYKYRCINYYGFIINFIKCFKLTVIIHQFCFCIEFYRAQDPFITSLCFDYGSHCWIPFVIVLFGLFRNLFLAFKNYYYKLKPLITLLIYKKYFFFFFPPKNPFNNEKLSKKASAPISHLYDIENKLFPDMTSQHSFGGILNVYSLKKSSGF